MFDDSIKHISRPRWYYEIKDYEQPSLRTAVVQILNTFIPYFILLGLMVYTVRSGYSYLITLTLAAAAAAFMVRIFVLFHDCTHNSFFASKRANRILGYIAGVLTLTAYEDWQWCHSQHHKTAGDLDRQGVGSIAVMTVDDYKSASKWRKFTYRFSRHPLVLFGLAPGALFILSQRFSKGTGERQRNSVVITNLAALGIAVAASQTIGLGTYIMVQLPVMLIAATAGVWLFFIQHNFEGMYWEHHNEVERMRVALEGSSFYDLPRVLRWFTANIGYHSLHHVRTHIPNYNLKRCYENTPELKKLIKPLTIRRSLKSPMLHLWDDKGHRLAGFEEIDSRLHAG